MGGHLSLTTLVASNVNCSRKPQLQVREAFSRPEGVRFKIHEVKTKKITTVKEVSIPGVN